jgi:DNA-binding transcriptional MerR regulator
MSDLTSDIRLTSGDVCELAGITQNMLDRWCRDGLLRPTRNIENGQGHHRTFGPLEAVAAAYAARWREAGFGPELVKNAARFVLNLGPEGLERELAAGRTFLLPPITGSNPYLIGQPVDPETGEELMHYRRLDLRRCLTEVTRNIAELSRGPANATGRNRGLAGGRARLGLTGRGV